MTNDLDAVRTELRRMGYLSQGMDRFLLQDAVRPRPALSTVWVLSLKVGGLAGVVLALGLALALAATNGNLRATPFDLPLLFLHLLPLCLVVAGGGFLALCGVLALAIQLAHLRRIETWSLVAALGVAVMLAWALWQGRGVVAGLGFAPLAGVAAGTALGLAFVVRVIYSGLLSLAIRLTDTAPRGRWLSRRGTGLVMALGGLLVTLPIAFAAGARGVPQAPASLPKAPGDHVVLLAIDGVLAEEFDYLLARGELPHLAQLAQRGTLFGYQREEQAPAAFWTTVATGVPPAQHGVAAVDTFRPLGVTTPLGESGPLRGYWARVAVPLGLAEHRPVLSSRRAAFTFWELASRGGAPVVVVNWWATYPAQPVPGVVVAHGAHGLLVQNEPTGAVEPASQASALAALAQTVPATAPAAAILADPARAERSVRPDAFYRQVFRELLSPETQAAALYLPALDIAADGWQAGALAHADLVRTELAQADTLLGEVAGRFGTVVVVVDPGRRLDGQREIKGRALIVRSGGCAAASVGVPGATGELAPAALASALVRALGLPQSAELPDPPGGCVWPAAPSRVPSFGRRDQPSAPAGTSGEYLQNLQSLGYL